MMLCPSVLYSVVSYCIVASYMLLSCICITMHVSLEPKSSKSPSKPWVEPFNYLMHPMAELRSELHTTRITLNMQSLDQKTKQTTGIVSMVPMKPTMWCYSATNNPRMDEHFFQPKKWLHFTKGGVCANCAKSCLKIHDTDCGARWGSGMKQWKWLWIHFHDTSFTYQYYTHTYAHKYCIYHIHRDHK